MAGEVNVFPFDPCPMKSAQALDDKRLWRVFIETVMMESCITGGKYSRIIIHKRLREPLRKTRAERTFRQSALY